MPRDYGLILLPMDGVAFLLSLGIFVWVTLGAYGAAGDPGQVMVQAGGLDYLYTLSSDGVHSFSGPEGDTLVEILAHRVRVLASPCRDQICVAAGWLDQTGQWTACLPNRIFVRVQAAPDQDNGIDAQVY